MTVRECDRYIVNVISFAIIKKQKEKRRKKETESFRENRINQRLSLFNTTKSMKQVNKIYFTFIHTHDSTQMFRIIL